MIDVREQCAAAVEAEAAAMPVTRAEHEVAALAVAEPEGRSRYQLVHAMLRLEAGLGRFPRAEVEARARRICCLGWAGQPRRLLVVVCGFPRARRQCVWMPISRRLP